MTDFPNLTVEKLLEDFGTAESALPAIIERISLLQNEYDQLNNDYGVLIAEYAKLQSRYNLEHSVYQAMVGREASIAQEMNRLNTKIATIEGTAL